MKFLVEIDDAAFKELRTRMVENEWLGGASFNWEVIRELFDLEMGDDFDPLDLRESITIEEIGPVVLPSQLIEAHKEAIRTICTSEDLSPEEVLAGVVDLHLPQEVDLLKHIEEVE